MKPIILTQQQWKDIIAAISNDYPPSVRLSRNKMKRVLGFTPREHTDWPDLINPFGYRTTIHLDFFDEQQRTMFLLKYGDKFGNQTFRS